MRPKSPPVPVEGPERPDSGVAVRSSMFGGPHAILEGIMSYHINCTLGKRVTAVVYTILAQRSSFPKLVHATHFSMLMTMPTYPDLFI